MTHNELKEYIGDKLNEQIPLLLEDETKANYVSVLAKMWSELQDYPENMLEWLTPAEFDEMFLTIYYACSRARHSITQGVNKEVKKYVKQADHEYQIAKEIQLG